MSAANPRSAAQSAASRENGARSCGPTSDAGKARAALNGVRHGLCGRTFFLLPDEDPAEFQEHERTWLASWRPRDLHEHEAALAAIRAMWREIRADRLEAGVLTDLFGADRIADDAERDAAKDRAFRALAMLLRYKARIEREHRAAMAPHRPARAPAAPAVRARANPRRRAAERTRAGTTRGVPGRGPRRAAAAGRTRAPAQPPPAPGAGGHGAACRLNSRFSPGWARAARSVVPNSSAIAAHERASAAAL